MCGAERKLIRAHVIPEAFFRVQRVDGEPPLLITNVAGHFPKRAPIGVYDERILCRDCEDGFQAVDDYGINVLLRRFDELFHPVEEAGRIVAFESDSVDQALLLRFLIAVLWRASVSTQPFYKGVQLGTHESRAAAIVKSHDSPMADLFGAVVSRWRTTGDLDGAADGMLDPICEQLMGVTTYRVYFGRIVVWVRVSALKFPAPMNRIELGSKPTLSVITRDFSKSKDLAAMVAVVAAANSDR